MRFFTTIVTTLLCLVASGLSAPTSVQVIPKGTYVIVNRVLSPAGDTLAVTFNGKDEIATLTPLLYSNEQRWIVEESFDYMKVSPFNNPDLEAAWASGGYVTVLSPGNYVWDIQETATGYSVQDGGHTAYWGTDSAFAGDKVTIQGDNGSERQRWIFHKVDDNADHQ